MTLLSSSVLITTAVMSCSVGFMFDLKTNKKNYSETGSDDQTGSDGQTERAPHDNTGSGHTPTL